MKTIDLQCRCGEVGLKITGAPVVQLYCHCDDCRAAQGGAYIAASIYPAPMVVKSTPRMRCPSCGTQLFAEITSVGLRSVNGFLLPKAEFSPQLHVQCQHAVLPVVDDLPHYKGFPTNFGGSEEMVVW
jgi:hypothetical protein